MYIPRNRVFWSVSLGHMTNDIFMSMGPVLLAFIGGVYFEIPPAYVGIALSAREMLGAISQPLFGWLSDKGSSRILAAGGVAITVGMLALSMFMAMVGNFWLMIVPFALSALGSGAFHPVGTAHASHGNEEKASTDTAYFFLFGQTGLALGPALIGVLLGLTQRNGEGGSVFPVFILALATIPSIWFMNRAIPLGGEVISRAGHREEGQAEAAPPPLHKVIDLRPLIVLGVLVTLRGVASHGAAFFIPTLFKEKGWTPAEYGGITSVFWFASAFAGVLFGYLADRFDRRWVVAGSLLLAMPFLIFMPVAEGAFAYLMVLAVGGLVGGSHSIIVVLAQSLLPGRKGFASGVTLGFIFGTGALGTLLLGYMADGAFGIEGLGLIRAFQATSVFVLAASVLALLLPPTRPRVRSADRHRGVRRFHLPVEDHR